MYIKIMFKNVLIRTIENIVLKLSLDYLPFQDYVL